MTFQINNIISQPDLEIKYLTYPQQEINTLDTSYFTQEELKRFRDFSSVKRKLEFYFTRVLWKSFGTHQPITYTSTGRPQVEKGYISISHSKDTIAIGYSSDHSIGLDIEHFSPKIKRVREKFLSEQELNDFDCDDDVVLTTLWSIKEAVYKLADIPGLSLRENILIQKVGETNEVILTTDASNNQLEFSRILFDQFILTHCNSSTLKTTPLTTSYK